MKKLFLRILQRPQERISFLACVRSGVKGFVTISLLSWMGYVSGLPLVITPFASSCITVFTSPDEEFAQPMNVVGGYIIATLVGLLAIYLLPQQWWVLGLALAVTMSTMAYFRVTHPPAGAVPFVLFFYHPDIGFDFLIFPVLVGSIAIVILAMILHRVPPARSYPSEN